MLETSARLLRLLALLQQRKDWAGPELATQLDITTRTLRRDIDRLRELGYPVNARIGAGGGYQLGAGAEMPPLLLDDDEALAVAVSLQAGTVEPVNGIAEASLRALTKLRKVMPSRLQHRFDALQMEVVPGRRSRSSIDSELLTAVSVVCHRNEQLRFDYRAQDGAQTRRNVEPYSVVRVESRWYLVAYDLDKDDWRSFRLDRMTPKIPTGPRFLRRALPDGGAAGLVTAGFRRYTSQVFAQVLVHGPLEQVTSRTPSDWGTVADHGPSETLVTLRGRSAADIAPWLTRFDLPFTVLEPAELVDECLQLAEHHRRLSEWYGAAGARSLE